MRLGCVDLCSFSDPVNDAIYSDVGRFLGYCTFVPTEIVDQFVPNDFVLNTSLVAVGIEPTKKSIELLWRYAEVAFWATQDGYLTEPHSNGRTVPTSLHHSAGPSGRSAHK